MNVQETIQSLKLEGYDITYHKNRSKLFCCILDDNGEPTWDSVSQVYFHEDKSTCLFFEKSIAIKKDFTSIDKLVKYIKQHFPIEK